MPAGDGTGPLGAGPMTGRAAGYCAGFSVPGYMNPWPGGARGYWRTGRGFGRGLGFGRGFSRGFGRGYRHWYRATGLPGWMRFGGYWPGAAVPWPGAYQAQNVSATARQSELDDLKAQAGELEQELQAIRDRIAELETSEEK